MSTSGVVVTEVKLPSFKMLMSEHLDDDPTARLPVLVRPDGTVGRTT